MLKSIKLKNFTAFKEAEVTFAANLNVIVGENGTGKTHILKLAYAALHAGARGNKDQAAPPPSKSFFQLAIAEKLMGVFKPDGLGRLARRDRRGVQRCEVSYTMDPRTQDLAFSLSTKSTNEVAILKSPAAWGEKLPVYLPTRELLSICPDFVALYESRHVPFDETWRDTCLLLSEPLARGPRESQIKKTLEPLETAMGGKVEMDKAGRFYLNIDGVSMEAHLIAEGLRKLAMIARLIATGSLGDKGYLLWDEPEANQNPKVIKFIARTILQLCQSGIQVIVASHSLFLLRELDILSRSQEFSTLKTWFIGLHRGGEGVEVQQGETVEDIGPIAALEEELTQSAEYLKLEAADANHH